MTSNFDKKEVFRPKNYRPRFDKRFIREIVEAIENGFPRSEAVIEHRISRSTISDWMREYGSQAYQARKQGHLSQQQIRSIVRSIEEGRLTVAEAKIAYNIPWTPTITKWQRDFRRENEELVSSNKVLMANKEENQQPDPDPDKMTLEQALKKLEESELKVKALNTLIDIAEEDFKIAIRKKGGAKQSKE